MGAEYKTNASVDSGAHINDHHASTSLEQGSEQMERFTALIGFFAILAIAWLLSTNRRSIKWRPVIVGLVLQIVVAILVLKGAPIAAALQGIALPLERWGAALVFVIAWVVA